MSTREIPKQEQLLNLFKVNKDTKTTPFTYFWTASFTSFYCLYDYLWADLMFCFGVSLGDFKQANTAEKNNKFNNKFVSSWADTLFQKMNILEQPNSKSVWKNFLCEAGNGSHSMYLSRTVKKVWSIKLEVSSDIKPI